MERMEKYMSVKMEIPSEDALRSAVLNGRIKPRTATDAAVTCCAREEVKDFAQKISDDMGLGFNLGNTFDAVVKPDSPVKGLDIETAWHNPKTTREMIAAIREGGFKTLRLPVSWHNHVSGPQDTVEPEWMDRIEEVVNWCIEEGMYVILNTHHDICPGFLLPDNDNIDRSREFMRNIWMQIARRFRQHSEEKLLFESMNEIRVHGADYEWTPDYDNKDCIDAMRNVNTLNQVFVDTVRSEGYKNSERCLIIPGYSTSTEGVCWDGFTLPQDTVPGRLFVAAHMYSPAHFAFFLKEGANLLTFDIDDPASTDPIDERLTKLYDKFVANGIPVALDEFGTVDKENDPERVKCLAYTLAKATQLGIRCCYWDNGVFFRYGDGMAIFDRKDLSFPRREPVDAMLRGIRVFDNDSVS